MKQCIALSFMLSCLILTMNAESLASPYDRLAPTKSFSVTSQDIKNGESFSCAQMSGAFGVPNGKDISPQLTWSGMPSGTKSFAVSMFDPDAPTPSGFWHWMVVNIPSTCMELANNAGSSEGKKLPAGAIQISNDARAAKYIGAAPPVGLGKHRYFIVVTALDIESLPVSGDMTPAYVSFVMSGHILGRAIIVASAEQK